MGAIRDDYDLPLEAPDPVEAELARELLQEQGIPSLLHGVDRDLAEFGAGVNARLARPSLYVPKGARERASAILDAAWEREPLPSDADVGAPVLEPPPEPERARQTLTWALFVLLAVVLVVLTIVQFMAQDRRD